MNSDIGLTVNSPEEGKWYHFGVFFRPKVMQEPHLTIEEWDGFLIKFQYKAENWEKPNYEVEDLWLSTYPDVEKTGTSVLSRDQNTLPNVSVIQGASLNTCDDTVCKFIPHIQRYFITMDPEDYQLTVG